MKKILRSMTAVILCLTMIFDGPLVNLFAEEAAPSESVSEAAAGAYEAGPADKAENAETENGSGNENDPVYEDPADTGSISDLQTDLPDEEADREPDETENLQVDEKNPETDPDSDGDSRVGEKVGEEQTEAPEIREEDELAGTDGLSENDYEYTTYTASGNTYAQITSYKGNLATVTIPETLGGYTVKKIGYQAFKSNTKIQKVVISDNITEIQEYCFDACSNLSEVTLSKNLNTLGYGAFRGTAISSIWIPASLVTTSSYGDSSIFANCTKLKTVEFEEGRTAIPTQLFRNCDSLETITIPDTVTSIENAAFQNSNNLRTVVFGANLTRIGYQAFSGCTGLQSINLPDSVTEIDADCFDGCTNLSAVTLSKNLQKLEYGAFRGTAISSIWIPASLVTTSSYNDNTIFAGCTNLKTVEFEEGISRIPNHLFRNCDSLETITIPDTVLSIGDSAFRDSNYLQTVVFGENLTKMENRAFSGCTGLQTVNLPDSVTEIGTYCFEGCTNLSEVTLSKNLQKLEYAAFKGTAISSIWIPASLVTTSSFNDSSIFADCKNLKTIEFEEGRTTIPKSLFRNCDSLETITLPDTVTLIAADAFRNCDNLRRVVFSEDLTKIDYDAFRGCTRLGSITLPDSVMEIGTYCFNGCTNLSDVTLSKNLQKIGYGAFGGSAISSIWIPASLKTTGTFNDTSVFSGCTNLKTVYFEAGRTTIPDGMFRNCDSLEKITVPDMITQIGQEAFRNCDNLSEIFISQSVKTINYNAFSGCPKLSFRCPLNTYATIYAIDNNIPITQYGNEELTYKVLQPRNTGYYLQVKNTVKAYLSYEIAEEYKHITDKALKIRIPANATLIESTLKLNDTVCRGYSYDNNNTLTIPVNDSNGVLTFNLQRNDSSTMYSYAMLTYKEGGVSAYDVINVIGYVYDGVTINADETVTAPTFNINGSAPKSGTVEILLDGSTLGTTTASKAGRYTYQIALNSPYDGQIYTVTARCTVNGRQYEADANVEYEAGAPEIKDFRLYYNNRGTGVDLLDDSKKPYVSYAPHVPFMFTIDIDNAETIDKVFVTSTRGNEKRSMEATYDANSGKYVARGFFDEDNHSYVPGTIRVEFQEKHSPCYVQETIPDNLLADMNRLSGALTATTVTTVKKESNVEEYSFDIGKSLETFNEELSDVLIDYNISMFDEESGKSVSDFMGMTEAAFDLAKYVVPGLDDKKYFVAMDYSDPTTYTMIVKDASSAANKIVKYQISLQGDDEWTKLNDIAPALGVISKSVGLFDSVAKNEKDYNRRKTQIDESLYIVDKEEAHRKNDELVKDQNFFALGMFVYAMLPTAIGLTGPAAIGLTALTGIIGACSGFFWDARIADMMGKGVSVKWAIDPSGYVYSQVPGNRLEGAKVTAFYKENEEDQNYIVWDASEYDQNNPLYTDADGKYAWDVPEGFWMVRAEMEGYETTDTAWMEVPPPRTDVAIRMIPDAAPKLVEVTSGSSYAVLTFDQYMDPDTISNVSLKDSEGKSINFTVEYDDPETDETGKSYAKEFRLIYAGYVLAGTDTLTVTLSDSVLSADGKAVESGSHNGVAEMEVSVQKKVKVAAGGQGSVRFTVSNYDGEKQFSAISDAPYICTVNSVDVDADGRGSISVTGGYAGETEIHITDASGKEYGSAVITVVEDGGQIEEDIPVASIELIPEKTTICVDETIAIGYTILPENATEKTLTWKSFSPGVAKVEDGMLTGISKGTAVIKALSNDGSGISQTFTVTVKEEGDEGFRIENISETGYVYTGQAIKPDAGIFYGNIPLTEKTDYTITFSNNTNAGDNALITVVGKGNYSGKETKTFKIIQKDISDPDITVSEIASAAYNKNKGYTPVPVITYNNKKLVNKKDFTVLYYMNESCEGAAVIPKEGGNYYAKVTGTVNFTGTLVIPFEIADSGQIPVSKLKIGKIVDQPYENGSQITPEPVVKDGSATLTKDSEYELFWGPNKEIGTGTVIIKGKDRYVGTRTVTFKITGTPVNKVTVGGIPKSLVYDGTAKAPVLTLTYKPNAKSAVTPVLYATKEEYDAMTDEEKADIGCILAFKNDSNIKAGTATLTLTGIHGFHGSVNKTFSIAPFNIAEDPDDRFKVTLSEDTYPYAKSGVKPKPEVTFDGKVLTEGKDYTLAYTANTAVNEGTGRKVPTVKVTGKGNFKGTDTTATFKIGKADMQACNIQVTAKDVVFQDKPGKWISKITVTDADGKALVAGKDYDNKNIIYSYDKAGEQEIDSKSVVSADTTVYVTVTAKGASYSGTATGSYRIVERDIGKLTATVTVPKSYTGKPVKLKPGDITWKSGNKPVENVTFKIDETTYKNNINKGKATVTLRGTGIYGGTKTVTFNIGTRGLLWR
ncbi:MAG: leucine-rich repeat protein [Lachnospiraceae bacterium]|nr:leucine-rich repeat protein [Lachnospiraceae bacterium]